MTEIEHNNPAGPQTGTAHALYIMHGLAPFTMWLLAIVAIIVAAATRDTIRGTWIESHYSWRGRTFWWGPMWVVISWIITGILFITVVGILLAWTPGVVLFISHLYRVIRG